jgi:predicted ferric reductase
VGRAVVAAAAAGLVAVLAQGIAIETGTELSAPGGVAIFIGSLTGLAGMYLALLMVVLVSRIPPVERILGQDGLLRWHRRLAPWPLSLIGLHAVIITIGYGQAAKTGFLSQIGQFVSTYPDMLAATVGLALMALAGIISIRAIRSRLRRETWWVIHLYLYLALALSFAHVIALGPSFVGHPLARALWVLVWVATAGSVLAFRFGLPLARSLRYQLRVAEVRPEAPGVVSVICTGRNLERLPFAGGQFVEWRFMVRGLWWQAHPYSVSALPRPPYLRLTVKAVGDHSAAVARLTPGTRVFFEGPYGVFTRHAQRHSAVALLAGGIGLTALRSLLEELPARSQPAVVVRVNRPEEFVFRSEVTELVRHRKGALHEVVGELGEVPFDARVLRKLVPDLASRDVYVCGPPGFVDHVTALAVTLGVDRRSVHHEAFAL